MSSSSQSPMFIFVHLGTRAIHYYNDAPCTAVTWADVKKVYDNLQPHLRISQGGCQIGWRTVSSNQTEWEYGNSRNTPQEWHAEESLFVDDNPHGLNYRYISTMFVRLKPCSDNRYGSRHNCMSLFHAGRTVNGIANCRFVPMACPEIADKGQFAVVFYLGTSAPAGQRSDTSGLGQAGRRNTTPPGQHTMTYAMGGARGTAWSSGGLWHIEGQDQDDMDADTLLYYLKHNNITQRTWNYKNPKVDDNKAHEVYHQLPK